MNFSLNPKFSRVLTMILVLIMMTTLFAGCKKTDKPEDTSDNSLNLNLSESTPPTPAETNPPETSAAPVSENSATVTSQLNIRSSPSTEATVVGTLYAGDKVEVSRREVVTGIDWAYIIAPEAGWIVMEYVEMDIPTATAPQENTPPAETTSKEEDNQQSTATNTKAVVDVNGLNIRSEASTAGKVQGAYNKGDVVTILETKNGWGRTNKGWIKMEYVKTAGTNTNTGTNDKDDDKTSNVDGNGSTTVQFRGIITASELNVRADADQAAERVGSYKYGTRVEILEKDGTWGRTKKGWISLTYVYKDGDTGIKTGSGVITATELIIRNGPGTGYANVGSYKQSERITILEQFTYDGITWGCTSKGWISLQYVQMDGISVGTDQTGTITGDELNIRGGPGTDYRVVGSLHAGDRVTILKTTVVDGVTWGNIDKGWISMQYVKLD